jgi:hypothetical protein
MLKRCHDPQSDAFHLYGHRGIAVCDEWRWSFKSFYDAVGLRPTPQHSIDRIDNARGYEPGNVRWATPQEQGANIRKNVRLTAFGETLHLSEWARRLGVHRAVLRGRLLYGWPVERAVSTPVQTSVGRDTAGRWRRT